MKIKSIVKEFVFRLGYRIEKINFDYPILRPIVTNSIEILGNPEFQNSCKMLGDTSLLDTSRLANLWMLCRITDPFGAIAEIGTYRGGGALHLTNCCPERQVVVCDPFAEESFEKVDPDLDRNFRQGLFTGQSKEQVTNLLEGRNCLIIPGYFPKSVKDVALPKLSFVHLDVDVYHATIESLVFLLTQQILLDKSLIVIDDYNRKADGVNKAVKEITTKVEGTLAFPMFPGQALIIPKSWIESKTPL